MQKLVLLVVTVVWMSNAAVAAMQPLDEIELSAIHGQAASIQEGVTIGANLNLNINEFRLTDGDGFGGSLSLSGINVIGGLFSTIEIVPAERSLLAQLDAQYGSGLSAALNPLKRDVLTITFPDLGLPNGHPLLPDVSIDAICLGSLFDIIPGLPTDDKDKNDDKPSRGQGDDHRRLPMSDDHGRSISRHQDNASPSFGSLYIDAINLQGTTVVIIPH